MPRKPLTVLLYSLNEEDREQAYRDEEQRWINDPKALLLRLQVAVHSYNEENPYDFYSLPVSMDKVLELKVSGTATSYSFSVRARCTKQDGTVGVLSFSEETRTCTVSACSEYEYDLKWEF